MGHACDRCEAPATEWHHPAGRLDGRQVADGFVMALCDDCHRTEHRIRRGRGLDRGPAPSTRVERAALVLQRVAVSFGRLGGAVFEGLAAVLVLLAGWITADIAVLDRRVPGWRDAIA